LQHDHRIKSFFAGPSVQLLQRLVIELFDLSLDDSREVLGL